MKRMNTDTLKRKMTTNVTNQKRTRISIECKKDLFSGAAFNNNYDDDDDYNDDGIHCIANIVSYAVLCTVSNQPQIDAIFEENICEAKQKNGVLDFKHTYRQTLLHTFVD
uniref:Uncharacterized protein n=1 Tax=Glossina brevipalpis TaxID=37001 RepID=A0A1A9WL06_9MUSC